MGWQQFSSTITGYVLSWPVLVLVIVLVLRKPIVALIESVRSYEGLGQKVTFGEQLAKVEEDVNEIASSQGTGPSVGGQEQPTEGTNGAELDPMLLVALANPSAAIMAAWRSVEIATSNLIQTEAVRARIEKQRIGPSTRRWQSAAELLRMLVRAEVVPGSLLHVLNDLRALRNRVAHGQHEPTVGEATTYVQTANELTEILERLVALTGREQPDKDEGAA